MHVCVCACACAGLTAYWQDSWNVLEWLTFLSFFMLVGVRIYVALWFNANKAQLGTTYVRDAH